jgi:hypothetical protein
VARRQRGQLDPSAEKELVGQAKSPPLFAVHSHQTMQSASKFTLRSLSLRG